MSCKVSLVCVLVKAGCNIFLILTSTTNLLNLFNHLRFPTYFIKTYQKAKYQKIMLGRVRTPVGVRNGKKTANPLILNSFVKIIIRKGVTNAQQTIREKAP